MTKVEFTHEGNRITIQIGGNQWEIFLNKRQVTLNGLYFGCVIGDYTEAYNAALGCLRSEIRTMSFDILRQLKEALESYEE